MKRILTAIALLAIATGSFAQDATKAAQQVEKLINQNDVDRIIKTLSADDMQGRATFTPGIEKAAQFIEGEFKQAGLVPLAGNKDFRQTWAMASVTPISTAITINGKTISADSIKITTSAASINWTNNSTDVQVVKLTADKNFQTEAAAYAASGKKMLILADPKFAANIKGRRGGGGAGRMKINDSQVLVYVIGNFGDVKSFNVSYSANVVQMPLFNVAGMIPGKSKPDEYVVFSGHYDHLGIQKGNKVMEGDSIANGADDDASGTTAVITLAKYFKKINNNERTLIFVAFCAEEIGEYGSAHFAETVDPTKVVAMFNIEMIGKAAKWGPNSALITGYERSDFGPILQKNLVGTAFKFYPDPYTTQNLFYRSDNASLARVGVPAHTISTDQIDSDKLYHTVKDEYSSLDVNNITATIKAIALSSRTIVSGADTPTRIPKLER
jgi:hypothetical protein